MMLVVCKPLGTKLTRSACGDRFVASNQQGSRPLGNPRIACGSCRGCEVGRAHAAGDRPEHWPDGSPIELVEVEPVKSERIGPPRTNEPSARRPTEQRLRIERTTPKPAGLATPAPRSKIEPVPDLEPDPVSPTGDTLPPPAEVEKPKREQRVRPVVGDADEPVVVVAPPRGRLVEVDGVSRSIPEWAKLAGIHPNAVYERIRRGWPLGLACTAPRGATYEHATPVGVSGRPRLGSSPIAGLPPGTPSGEEPTLAGLDLDDAAEVERVIAPTTAEDRGAIGDAFSKLFGPAPLSPRELLELAGFEVVGSGKVPAGSVLVVRRKA